MTYRRSGEPVPTPVWFGLGDGKLYVRSEANVAKAKRIRNDPRVRVARCTARGKPLGPPAEGRGRVLEQQSERALVEAALRANYGLGRTLYEGAGEALGIKTIYLEITPASPLGWSFRTDAAQNVIWLEPKVDLAHLKSTETGPCQCSRCDEPDCVGAASFSEIDQPGASGRCSTASSSTRYQRPGAGRMRPLLLGDRGSARLAS